MPLAAQSLIKKPLITEKSTYEMNEYNRYAFEVVMSARKPEIKSAIEEIYGVRVKKIATQVRKGNYFRNRFGTGKRPDWKKAIVVLHEEDRIDLF